MPRITLDSKEQRRRQFHSIVRKYTELYAYDNEKIARLWGVSSRTVHNRMKEPDKIALEDLRRLCHALHFSDEDRLALMKIS